MKLTTTHAAQAICLFHHPLSGHLHRVERFVSLLGLPLDAHPNLRAWLARIEALPCFVGMRRSPAADALGV